MSAPKNNKSKHHLFTYHEIRKKLIQVLGEPVTNEDHVKLQAEIRKVHKKMPVYLIDHDKHMAIHKGDIKGCSI
jgi:protoporphyrinogen oxidase